MNEAILIAKDVRKVYTNGAKEVRAVDGVSLGIKRGGSTAIVGPSGAGKSTLLHILGGLDLPTSGEVRFDGVNIYGLSDSQRAGIRNRKIGFVFQFYHLLPEFTALENVMLPALMKKPETRNQSTENRAQRTEIKEKGFNILKLVGLQDRASHKPGELSGGESQRVAIARALVNGPEILLCDEPTGNLDSKTSESIYELLFNLKSRSNMSLVIVTHDEHLSQRTDETIRIRDGKTIS
jgi:lipoprotein-releasing system ATP-binding protein